MAQLLLAGAGMKATGEIMAGRAAEKEGLTAYKIGLYNQQVKEREARAIEQKTRLDSFRQAKFSRQKMGALRTQIAASGAEMGTGAAEALENEQFAELELENMLIGYEGSQQAARARQQGQIYVTEGIMAKKRGRMARKLSYLQAGSTLLSGFAAASSPGSSTGPFGGYSSSL
ncbi:MAG: hypothetical protein JXA96_17115 [Sedimentisphaerales bacterium]|nr:hypothetical protein [Sedimentisphaerales bacterium]